MITRRCGILVLVVALTSACSATYMPRRSAHIKILISAGQEALLKDDRIYPLGFAGGGLVDAVRDNPRALDHAEAYQSGTLWGLAGVLAGAVAIGASPVALVSQTGNRNGRDPDMTLFSALMGGGLLLYSVGIGALLSAHPHIYDAVNQYNDDVLFGAVPAAMPSEASGAASR